MTILHKIIAHTKGLVAERRREISIDDLKAKPAFHAPALSLRQALRRKQLSIIGEIKKASPSKGTIRPEFNVPEIARQYRRGGAAAISVLTEPDHFLGSIDYLAQTRWSVDLPLLRKDFIIDPYQLFEARANGADGVLLIATALEKNELYDLHALADELELDCLVEAYAAEDLEKIDFDQISILGINNRDLHTFEVDVEHSLELFDRVPSDIVRVSESGLKTPGDLAQVRRSGIDAVLIGETFMRAHHPGRRLANLATETQRLLDREQKMLRKVG